MSSVNRTTTIGRLGADPEIKMAGSTSLVTVSVATSESRPNPQGGWIEDTEWHTVKVWGETAKYFHRKCRKGTQVYIEGSLRSEVYQEVKKSYIKCRSFKVMSDGIKAEYEDSSKLLPAEPAKADDPWADVLKPQNPWGT